MTGRFHLPREHGGWTLWGTAIVAGVAHALGHGAILDGPVKLAAGLLLLYGTGDVVQSLAAKIFKLPHRGTSDAFSEEALVCFLAGWWFVSGTGPDELGRAWMPLVVLVLLPAAISTYVRASRPAFDRWVLGTSSFSLSMPALLFGVQASPACWRCALSFWSLPAVGFPLMTLLIATRLPAPPATVKRLGWLAAAVTVFLAAGWVALFRLLPM